MFYFFYNYLIIERKFEKFWSNEVSKVCFPILIEREASALIAYYLEIHTNMFRIRMFV